MFLYATYKSPLWKDSDPTLRITKTVIAGLVCYILLYATTYTKYVKSKEVIIKNRNYLGGLIVLDLAATMFTHKKLDKPKKSTDEKFVEHVPDYAVQYPPPQQQYLQQYPPQQQVQVQPTNIPVQPTNIPVQHTLPLSIIQQTIPILDDLFIKIDTQSDDMDDMDDNEDIEKDVQDIPVYNTKEDTLKEESIPIYVPKASL